MVPKLTPLAKPASPYKLETKQLERTRKRVHRSPAIPRNAGSQTRTGCAQSLRQSFLQHRVETIYLFAVLLATGSGIFSEPEAQVRYRLFGRRLMPRERLHHRDR